MENSNNQQFRQDTPNKLLIPLLITIILVLVGIGLYLYWIQPAYNNFIQEKQATAYTSGQVSILQGIFIQIKNTGYVQIPISENQSIYLAPFNPELIK